MVLKSLLALALVTSGALADPCADLDRLLDLGAGSYAKGIFCHALFWQVQRGSGPICFHSTRTLAKCPATHNVSAEEAKREYERLVGLWDSDTTTTTESAEVSTRASIPRTLADATETPADHWVKPSGPVEMAPLVRTEPGPLQLLLLGDVGYANSILKTSVKTARRKVGSDLDAAFLMGDNFYPKGIITDVSDPQFKDVFVDIIAKEFSSTPFHAILGNHDWMGNADAQLQYTSIHKQWHMPYYFYTRRFVSSQDDTVACVWFLNTEAMDTRRYNPDAQLEWLEETLSKAGDCSWKILVGHHPIYDGGEYSDNKRMIAKVLPIAEKWGVDLYLSGHEHQTQVLHNPAISNLHFIISGCTAEKRGGEHREHAALKWIDPKSTAFVQLSISRSELVYRIHKAAGDPAAAAMYEGRITTKDTAVVEPTTAEFVTPTSTEDHL